MKRTMRLTRDLVERIPAAVDDPGPMAMVAALEQDNYHQCTADSILANLPEDGALWVFAFGSLIWKSRFRHVEQRVARVEGWHRSFCLGLDTRYRDNPDAPGLMLSLDQDGEVDGIVFRLAPDTVEIDLVAMLETEPPIPPVLITAETADGPVRCIAHVSGASLPGYMGDLSDDEVADLLQRAVGMYGSMPDYLYNTVHNLEAADIHDPYLWRMQELVAERLEKLA
jgi:cation transport protein ChaC